MEEKDLVWLPKSVAVKVKQIETVEEADSMIQEYIKTKRQDFTRELENLREMGEQKLRLTIKPCGDCWLHIDAPSGKKASINLGQRGGFNDQTIVESVIREVAEILEEK